MPGRIHQRLLPMEAPAARHLIKAANAETAELAGTKTLKILVMVNTKRASLLKTAIASSASCWREPFFLKNSRGNIRIRSLANPEARTAAGRRAPGPGHFFLILRRERASKRASREGGPEVHELVSEQAYERFASKQALMCPQSSAASGGTSRMSASKPRTDEL